MSQSIIALDLFCGAGGLTRGFLDAGIDVIGGFDIEPAAQQAYEENNIRPNGEKVKYFLQSVTDLKRKQVLQLVGTKAQRKKDGKKFLLAGCAPCQPFSMKNNKRGDKKDHRRTLIVYFADLIRQTNPDFVFMENVTGLEKFEPENFKYFTDTLDSKGYSWDKKVVNALDYGVPQNRKRFVLVASKVKDVNVPKGEYGHINKPYKTVGDVIKHLEPIEAGESHRSIPNHKASNLQMINRERLQYKNRLEWPEHLWLECHKKSTGYTDSYGKMDWSSPAPTLTTKFFSVSNGRYGHPDQVRAISLREGALLQTFPENYKFFETSIQQVARQIGNAVPPKMAEAFGKYFLRSIAS